MTKTYDEHKQSAAGQAATVRAQRRTLHWRSLGVAFGFAGGLLSVLLGSVLTASAWFTGTVGYGAHARTWGTIFFCLTIPLLVLGAHCLDLMEKQKYRERAARLNAAK